MSDAPEDPSPPRGSRAWATVRLAISILLAAVALYVVAGRSDELTVVSSYLSKIDPFWVVAAFGLEMVSIAAFALIQRRLAAAGGVDIPATALFGITLAGNSITNSLPAGPAWASYFSFRQYRRFGADSTLSAWILIGLFLASSLTLAVLATAGLIVASTTGAGSFGITNTIVSVVFGTLAVTGTAVLFLHRRGTLEPVATRFLYLSRRLVRYPRGDPALVAARIVQRLRAVSPSRSDAVVTLGWAMVNWVTDLLALVASFYAVGVAVPWSGILLAYGAGQLAANLPVTPGGLGVVEGSLEVALVAYGGSQGSTVAAILLYRIVSFWLLLPLGWISWLSIHFAERKDAVRSQPALPPVTTAEEVRG